MSNRLAEIERLARLHAEGALSDQEFQAEKARILSDNSAPPPGYRSGPTAAPKSHRSRFIIALCLLAGVAFAWSSASFVWFVIALGTVAVSAILLKTGSMPQSKRRISGILTYSAVLAVVSFVSAVGACLDSAESEKAEEQRMANLKRRAATVEKAITEFRFGDAEKALNALASQVTPSSPTVATLRTKLDEAKAKRRDELTKMLAAHVQSSSWGEASALCKEDQLAAVDMELQPKCTVARIGEQIERGAFDDAWDACRTLGDGRTSLVRAQDLCATAGKGFAESARGRVDQAHASEEWQTGRDLCLTLEGAVTEGDPLMNTCSKIELEYQRAEDARRKQARAELVEQKTATVLAVVSDKEKCDTPLAVSDAWKGIKDVAKDDPGYSKAAHAVRKLERCRKDLERKLTKGLGEVMKKQRDEYAAKLERLCLDRGLDIRVRARGTTLKFTFVLFNRAWAHQLTEGGSMAPGSMLKTAEGLGFKRVVFADGYDESYIYTLEPMSEKAAIREHAMLPELRAPLKL